MSEISSTRITVYKAKLDSTYEIIRELSKNSDTYTNNLGKDIMDEYTKFLKNLSSSAVCLLNSRNRLKQSEWNSLEGTLYDDIKKLSDKASIVISKFFAARTALLELFNEEEEKYSTLDAIPQSKVTYGTINSGNQTTPVATSGGGSGSNINITGGTVSGGVITWDQLMELVRELLKERDDETGAMQCNCSCSPELLELLKQLTELLNGLTPSEITDENTNEGETTPYGVDVPDTGVGEVDDITTPDDVPSETPDDNINGEEYPDIETPDDTGSTFTPSTDDVPSETPDDNINGEEYPDIGTPDDTGSTFTPSTDYPDIPSETPGDGYDPSFVNPFDTPGSSNDTPDDPFDNGRPTSGGNANEQPTPPPSNTPGGSGNVDDGSSTFMPSKDPSITGDDHGSSLAPSTNPDNPSGGTGDTPSGNPDVGNDNNPSGNEGQNPSGGDGGKPSGGTTDWGGGGSTGTGGTPGGTTGGDDPFAKDRDPNVSVENVGKEWVTLGGAATGAGAAAGVVGGYGGGGTYYATNTGNSTGDSSSSTQFSGVATDDEEKKKKAKYIFSSEQAEVENPYEGMEPDSLYGNSVVYDTLEPNGTGNATDTTSMDADGTNLGTILGIGGISAGLGVGGLYMAQAKKDAKKEEEEKKKKEQEEKDAESLGLVGGVMASSFIDDDDDDDKKKKKKQNNRSFFN